MVEADRGHSEAALRSVVEVRERGVSEGGREGRTA